MTTMHIVIVYLIYKEAFNVTIYPEMLLIVQTNCYPRIIVLLCENKNHILKFIDPMKCADTDQNKWNH